MLKLCRAQIHIARICLAVSGGIQGAESSFCWYLLYFSMTVTGVHMLTKVLCLHLHFETLCYSILAQESPVICLRFIVSWLFDSFHCLNLEAKLPLSAAIVGQTLLVLLL